MRYGILITPDTATKAKNFLNTLRYYADNNGIDCAVSHDYQPCDVLILYGLGGVTRFAAAANHLQQGKPFIAWDLPYWNRNGNTFRMSVNGNHPKQVMMGDCPGVDRFKAADRGTDSVANPDGPVMLVGNGPKSNAVGASGWAKRRAKEIQQAMPDRELIYRPKPRRPIDKGCDHLPQSTGPIDAALQGVSLLVCRHSNVAVDACRLGVPVVCDDGAASLIYPNSLDNKDNQPSDATRLEFLHRLAWWQYSIEEAGLAWQWMEYALTLDAASELRTGISI